MDSAWDPTWDPAWDSADLRIVVGSTNPVKVQAVEAAFAAMFPPSNASNASTPSKTCVFACSVASGVSDQPMTDAETRDGASNRATAAAATARSLSLAPDGATAYAVGLEGGVAEDAVSGRLECFAWMVVHLVDVRTGSVLAKGSARTASFPLPDTVSALVRAGVELGIADDIVFARCDSKKKDGAVGLLSHGIIDRTAYYEHALKLALIPFANPSLYGVDPLVENSNDDLHNDHDRAKADLASAVLMVRPAAFGPNPETAASNVFQDSSPIASPAHARAVTARAVAEFDAMVATLRSATNTTVHVVQDSDVPPTPDAVFPNNWFSTHVPRSAKAPQVVLYQMEAPARQAEVRPDLFPTAATVHDMRPDLAAQSAVLEGTGSMVLDRTNGIVYAALSSRTHEHALAAWADRNDYPTVVSFTAVDATLGLPIYHTNVLMALGATFAVVCLDALASPADVHAVCAALVSSGKDLIPISHHEMSAFAGNMLQVRDPGPPGASVVTSLILSSTAAAALSPATLARLAAHNDRIVPVDVPTIERYGGGSARCMLAEWFLSDPPNTPSQSNP